MHVSLLALGILYGAPGPVAAQNPTGAQVELWYGMRRVDGMSPAQPATTPAFPPVRASKDIAKGDETFADALLPPPPPQLIQLVSAPLAHSLSPPDRHVPESVKPPAVSSSPAKSSSAPAFVLPEPNLRLWSPGRVEKGEGFNGIPQTQLLCIISAVGTGPLLGALACWLLLRRSNRGHGQPLRVDFSSPPIYGVAAPSASVGSQPLQPDGPSGQVKRPESRPAVRSAVTPARPASAAEAFDPGPTFAAVRQQKEDALRQHEEGILQYLVDQNVRLMEQIA